MANQQQQQQNMNEEETGAAQLRQLMIRDAPLAFIPDDELVCEFVHPTLIKNHGIMINFVNHNCPDAATIIGGIRMRSDEIVRIPMLMSRHQTSIKAQAAYFLQKHLSRCQSALGVNEVITVDDLSLSFMVASLSATGMKLHPSGRNEGPLHFCLFSNLVEPAILGYASDGTPISSYVINAYVHLLDQTRRRGAVVRKAEEEKKRMEMAKKADAESTPSAAKKPKFQGYMTGGYQGPKWVNPGQSQASTQELKEVTQSIKTLVTEVKQLRLPIPQYPALPDTQLQWPPAEATPAMPEDL